MNYSKGTINYSYKGKEVQDISDLPEQDYQELMIKLVHWKRNLSNEVIRQYMKANHPSLDLDVDWSSDSK